MSLQGSTEVTNGHNPIPVDILKKKIAASKMRVMNGNGHPAENGDAETVRTTTTPGQFNTLTLLLFYHHNQKYNRRLSSLSCRNTKAVFAHLRP